MCYWASWAVYRSGNGNHTIDHIDPAYCTHIIYSFAGLNMAGSIDALDFTSDIAKGVCDVALLAFYCRFVSLRVELVYFQVVIENL